MNIIIHRNGENYGPYTLNQVKEYLEMGVVTEMDLGWSDGSGEWLPLKEIILGLNSHRLSESDKSPRKHTDRKLLRWIVVLIGGAAAICLIGLFYLKANGPDFGVSVSTKTITNPVPSEAINNDISSCINNIHVDGDVASGELVLDQSDIEPSVNAVKVCVWYLSHSYPSITKINLVTHIKGHDDYGQIRQTDVTISLDNLAKARGYTSAYDYKSDPRGDFEILSQLSLGDMRQNPNRSDSSIDKLIGNWSGTLSVADHGETSVKISFNQSGTFGSFYGSDLPTFGNWWIKKNGNIALTTTSRSGLVTSFGTVILREDGTIGVDDDDCFGMFYLTKDQTESDKNSSPSTATDSPVAPTPSMDSVAGLYSGTDGGGFPGTIEFGESGKFINKDPALPNGMSFGDWALHGDIIDLYVDGQKVASATVQKDGKIILAGSVWDKVR